MLKNTKGITLIALIITIIVLLILAGMSINLILGDNGILEKSRVSKLAMDIAQEKEAIGLSYSAVKSQKMARGDTAAITGAELNIQLQEDGVNATAEEDNPIIVTFSKSGRQYEIYSNGEIMEIVGPSGGSSQSDWETILEGATKPEEQQTTDDIGIDANGNICNLDLWRYDTWSEYDEELEDYVDSGIMLGTYMGSGGGQLCYKPFDEGNPYPNAEKTNIVCLQYIKKAGSGNILPVTCLASCAFEDCDSMVTIKLPSTLEIIGHTVFNDCDSLNSLTIPDSVETLDSNDGSGVGSHFNNCDRLTYLKIGAGLKEFDGQSLIYGCTNLRRIDIDSATVISGILGDTYEDEWGDERPVFDAPFLEEGIAADIGLNVSYDDRRSDNIGYEHVFDSIQDGYALYKAQHVHEYEPNIDYWMGDYYGDIYHYCVNCNYGLGKHIYANGICTICGHECSHEDKYAWRNFDDSISVGKCTICGQSHTHVYENGECTICGLEQNHTWDQDYWISDLEEYGHYCYDCSIEGLHIFNNSGICIICEYECDHDDGYYWCNAEGRCSKCNQTHEHTYSNGYCTVCGYSQ